MFKPYPGPGYILPNRIERLKAGDLSVVGWDDGIRAMVTRTKAIKRGNPLDLMHGAIK